MDEKRIKDDAIIILDRWYENMKTLLSTPMPMENDFEMLMANERFPLSSEGRLRRHELISSWLMTQMAYEIANINVQLQKLQYNQK